MRPHQLYGGNEGVRVITTAREYTNAARNTGFRAATGELICFLDSDDFWMGHMLAVVGQIFAEHPELAFLSVEGSTLPSPSHPLVTRVVAKDAPGWAHAGFRHAPLVNQTWLLDGPQRNATLLYGDYFPAIIHGDLFMLSGLVIRRDAIVRAGPFTEHFRFYNDREFFARLCLQGAGVISTTTDSGATPGAWIRYRGPPRHCHAAAPRVYPAHTAAAFFRAYGRLRECA